MSLPVFRFDGVIIMKNRFMGKGYFKINEKASEEAVCLTGVFTSTRQAQCNEQGRYQSTRHRFQSSRTTSHLCAFERRLLEA